MSETAQSPCTRARSPLVHTRTSAKIAFVNSFIASSCVELSSFERVGEPFAVLWAGLGFQVLRRPDGRGLGPFRALGRARAASHGLQPALTPHFSVLKMPHTKASEDIALLLVARATSKVDVSGASAAAGFRSWGARSPEPSEPRVTPEPQLSIGSQHPLSHALRGSIAPRRFHRTLRFH